MRAREVALHRASPAPESLQIFPLTISNTDSEHSCSDAEDVKSLTSLKNFGIYKIK